MAKTWGVDEGLPESSVTDVVQSRDGYLWVSTLNSGLSRFDGVRFVNFTLPFVSQFTGGGVRRLFADETGTLWINGFGNYLASLRSGTFQLENTQSVVINYLIEQKNGREVFATKEGQLLEWTSGDGTNGVWKTISLPGAGQNIHCFSDAQGNFWYRSTNGAVYCAVGEIAEIMPSPPGEKSITALAGDNQGSITVGNSAGLFVWENGKFQDVTPIHTRSDVAVKGLVSDGRGGWWVEAGGRLRRCRDRQWVAEANSWYEQNRLWQKVRWEQADASGGLWLAYTDGGVVHVSSSGKLSALGTSEGLPSNRVRTLAQDREGNAWASFERGGLVRIRPRLFQAVGRREGLADSVTTSVCEDHAGAIWIGTLSGAVSRWQNGVCSNFTLPLEGTHCDMSTVFPDSTGRVWIGTHGNGLLVYEYGKFRHVLSVEQAGINIRGIFIARDGRVWIASQDGLFCYADGKVRQVLQPKSEADYPTALAEAADGGIWVAMNTGALLKIRSDKVLAFQPADPAMHSRFSAVCEDAQGTVWIGTLGAGLLRFRNGQFSAITKRDGLPSDNISQVIEDEADVLWLGSSAGVVSMQKSFPDAGGEYSVGRVFGRDDGLPTVGCATTSQPTAWRGHDGRLWFATANGVTSVQPKDAETRPRPPLVVLEDLLVDGQPLSFSAGEGASRIRLTPGRHRLEFRFTGLSFTSPEGIRFKYMLEGLDGVWMENRPERNASYNSVPPGEYRFRVAACNSAGQWSEKESSLALIMPPHIWETRRFFWASLAALLALVGGSVFWMARVRHRRQVEALEQQHAVERERLRIAQDLHDDLGTTLTQIDLLGALAARPEMSSADTLQQVGLIQIKSREMVTALDEIVWAVNPRNDSLSALITYLCNFAEDFLGKSSINCRLDIADELPDSPLNSELRHHLFLAFKEALNNVLRHSGATEAWIRFATNDRNAVLVIQDNGRGFDSQTIGLVTRGNGLRNMRQRIGQIGGKYELQSEPGKGTRIAFIIPLP
jgi:signal transduction histidine kinase/ligand-binding sensor domain-containing protein